MVALELDVDALQKACDRYWPIVDRLREAELVADALAIRLREAASFRLTKVHLAIGLLALFVPAVVSSLLTLLLLKATKQ